MHNIGGRLDPAVPTTTVKVRGTKKKRCSLALTTTQEEHVEKASSSNSFVKGSRRKSVPDEWDPMGCNFRVDMARAHYQKAEITMPEIHHGIAASSMPIPLNTIMKTWNNIPKLHQYQPSQLQVVYHRRTGETETVEVKPEPVKPPERDDLKILSSHVVPMSRVLSTVPKLSEFHGADVIAASVNNKQHTSEPEIIQNNSGDEKAGLPRQLYNNKYVAVENHQLAVDPFSTSSEADVQGKFVECQVDQGPSTGVLHRTNDCETQTSQMTFVPGDAIRYNQIADCSNQYQCRASQNEPLELFSNLSSQSTSISIYTQTEPEPKNAQIEKKAVEMENSSLSTIAVQVDLIKVLPSTECGSQTEIDIETPQLCLMCDFKQLQMQELEENILELQERFKITQMELESIRTRDEHNDIIDEKPTVQYSDASTNTNDLLPASEEPQSSIRSPPLMPSPAVSEVADTYQNDKYIELELENENLKATVETLKSQLGSFQCGLKRLRAAIEKPIIDDSNEAAIQQVLHKADNFIMNSSSSQSRAVKINDHLSVLNTCVSVANGIMKETLPPK